MKATMGSKQNPNEIKNKSTMQTNMKATMKAKKKANSESKQCRQT